MTTDSISKEQKQEITASLRRYFADNLDRELSEMQAGFLLEYFLTEIAPFAYNKGVEDARRYFFTMTEDLAGACFEEPLTFWKKSARDGSRDVRRKQGR
jgi:uncharacterized protein (DUF2164 family)